MKLNLEGVKRKNKKYVTMDRISERATQTLQKKPGDMEEFLRNVSYIIHMEYMTNSRTNLSSGVGDMTQVIT